MITALWFMLAAALAVLTSLAIWSRRPTRARWLAVGALPLTAGLAGLVMFLTLGRPLQVMQWMSSVGYMIDEQVPVLGVKIEEGVAITLMIDTTDGPRLVTLPWREGESEEDASTLQRLVESCADVELHLRDGESAFGEQPESPAERKPPVADSGITYERR